MSSAERLPQPTDQPEHEGQIVPLQQVAHQESEHEMHIEDRILLSMLDPDNREFALEQMEKYGARAILLNNAAWHTYRTFIRIIESDGRLHYIDQFGKSHPIHDSDDDQPTAA